MLGLTAIYCSIIVVASLIGGLAPSLLRPTHKRMELAVSFVAGVMLGIGLLQLIPHASEEIGPSKTGFGVLLGLLTLFFIERFFCFHHHDVPNGSVNEENGDTQNHANHTHAGHDHQLTWSGAALGLSLHTLIAGIGLAASLETHKPHHSMSWPPGMGMFLVIVLHKPFDSLTLWTLMAKGSWAPRWRHCVNVIFALLIPIGIGMFYLLGAVTEHHQIVGWALAFSGGAFLCISLSDLLPELQFHQHDRWKLSAALMIGVAIAAMITMGESYIHPPELH